MHALTPRNIANHTAFLYAGALQQKQIEALTADGFTSTEGCFED